jgi:hypothetical protein
MGRKRLPDGLTVKKLAGKCWLCHWRYMMVGVRYDIDNELWMVCEVCFGRLMRRREDLRWELDRRDEKRRGAMRTKREYWEARQRLVRERMRRAELRRMREAGDGRDGGE